MKYIKYAFFIILFINITAFGSTEKMNADLVRISRILSRINPLINLAQKQQDKNARVQFQFNKLRADIGKIQAGIAEQINRISIQPRIVAPITGDYLPAAKKQKTIKRDT